MYRADPKSLHLAAEFRERPIGDHSPELERLLSLFRSGPVRGKYCLVCVEPYRRWVLAQLSGERNVPPLLHHNRVFASLAEAEWEIFKLRWHEHTGVVLRDEDL